MSSETKNDDRPAPAVLGDYFCGDDSQEASESDAFWGHSFWGGAPESGHSDEEQPQQEDRR